MGTKLTPGEFDCFSAAKDDEPLFTLLARDPLAPVLIEFWAKLRQANNGCSHHPQRSHDRKIQEALEIANAMRQWRKDNPNV